MKEIYLVRTSSHWGAYIPCKYPVISYAPADEFVDFIQSLREDFEGYKLRCIVNEGIKQKIDNRIRADNMLKANSLLGSKNRDR